MHFIDQNFVTMVLNSQKAWKCLEFWQNEGKINFSALLLAID